MRGIEERFAGLSIEHAPGQHESSHTGELDEIKIGPDVPGQPVDFSHGDVDAFTPPPNAFGYFQDGVREGGAQAYTAYSGKPQIRATVAQKLSAFTGAAINSDRELILTPGTQGALFLAMASCVGAGDKVAIVEPDYFPNRKLVKFFGGIVTPVRLHFETEDPARLDLEQLEAAFKDGVKVFVFSNPNNPTGVVYSAEQIHAIAELANKYDVTVIADQLYSRLLYSGVTYTHLAATEIRPDRCLTIMGPSKTESMSGYRLGAAFGAADIVSKMEQVQGIVSLRAAGYNQAAFNAWFNEPEGWMNQRIQQHEAIRDELVDIFNSAGLPTHTPDAGSYLFPRLPQLNVSVTDLVALLREQAGVTVTAGQQFGPHHGGYVRLNFSQDHQAAIAAAKRMVEIVKRYTK